jgi:hypothetical protein
MLKSLKNSASLSNTYVKPKTIIIEFATEIKEIQDFFKIAMQIIASSPIYVNISFC